MTATSAAESPESSASHPLDALRTSGEVVESFAELGITAFTTGRSAGSFGTQSDEPVRDVMARWSMLRASLGGGAARLATATQVHGAEVMRHRNGWDGWLRGNAADGHISAERGTGMAVTIADCVPVFIGHRSGALAVLHSGWRGTVARITEVAVQQFRALGLRAEDLRLHCGPAICGRCYEVSPEVFAQLTGRDPGKPTVVDLRAIIADHARALGVRAISLSPSCTRCDNDRFYSHRVGDAGRQVGVALAPR